MRWLVGLAGLLAIGAAAPAPRAIAPGKFAAWTGASGTRSWTSGGVTATLAARGWGDGSSLPTLTVRSPGKEPLTVKIDDGETDATSYVAIGPLGRGQSLSVVVQSWTGGAHCCFRLIAVVPAGDRLRAVDFGDWDGDRIAWPRDRDGDGVADFVLQDQSFLYAFGSYAGSWPPPRIMTIRDGSAVDISNKPAFRSLFAADLPGPRKACFSKDEGFFGGACAAYLADSARLGQFDAAWANVAPILASADTGPFPASCDDTPRPTPCYDDYATAVRAFLRSGGYIR